jgi:hypothetical protein
VKISEQVWATWRDSPKSALEALAAATDEVMRARYARADAVGEEEFWPGYCSFSRTPEGVVLRIGEGPDDFEGLLQGIAYGLRARGIDAQLDLYEPEVAPEIPELIDLFECHLRIGPGRRRGRRRRARRHDHCRHARRGSRRLSASVRTPRRARHLQRGRLAQGMSVARSVAHEAQTAWLSRTRQVSKIARGR